MRTGGDFIVNLLDSILKLYISRFQVKRHFNMYGMRKEQKNLNGEGRKLVSSTCSEKSLPKLCDVHKIFGKNATANSLDTV